MKTSFILLALVLLVVITQNACNSQTEPNQVVESSISPIEEYSDTTVTEKYENGEIMTVIGYRNNDTIMKYQWTYYQHGKVWIEGPVYHSMRHGKWKAYNEEGNLISMGVFKMGKGEGMRTVWYDDGTKFYEGVMLDGERVGKWQFYDKQGSLTKEIDYNAESSTIQNQH